jgi:hypothetical protein
MGSKIWNLHRGREEHRGHREERMGEENSPDGLNYLGATDFTIRGNQRKPLDERCGSDDAVRWIFGISGSGRPRPSAPAKILETIGG